jgi:hypothetical protein
VRNTKAYQVKTVEQLEIYSDPVGVSGALGPWLIGPELNLQLWTKVIGIKMASFKS